jgi:hypothetical protein
MFCCPKILNGLQPIILVKDLVSILSASTIEVSAIPVVLVLLIVFVLSRRIIRNNKGIGYSVRSIFITPIIYVVLSAYFLIGLGIYQDLGVAVAVVIGVLVGTLLGRRSEIFEKDGKVMYKRSMEVMAIWLVGFIIRIAVDFLFNPQVTSVFGTNSIISSSVVAASQIGPILLGADILLAFSAGLLLGEALILYMKHRSKYSKKGWPGPLR